MAFLVIFAPEIISAAIGGVTAGIAAYKLYKIR
jgi:hypothetical protein